MLWVLGCQIGLEELELVEGHTDEWIARVDKGVHVSPELLSVEAGVVDGDLPAHRMRCVEPDLLVALLEEILVVASESHLRWGLGRVVKVSMHAENFL